MGSLWQGLLRPAFRYCMRGMGPEFNQFFITFSSPVLAQSWQLRNFESPISHPGTTFLFLPFKTNHLLPDAICHLICAFYEPLPFVEG
jgi:hypothetical protein